MPAKGPVSGFMEKHFRHFNARETLDAALGFEAHVDKGGRMMLAMAGAMSTGELGVILARMIRAGKIHAISCTAANMEEDVFNLVAHDEYAILPNYWDLSPEDETRLRDKGFNRVTDTAIPETVFRHLEHEFMDECRLAHKEGKRYFPFEIFKKILLSGRLEKHYQIPKENSWLLAACEAGIPVYTPGWEDCTLGNIFTARIIEGEVPGHGMLRSGTEQMQHLVEWYLETVKGGPIGFFQIGGGIAGDFAICAVPLIVQDLEKDVPLWGYFCQITDATTSYGGYSGAMPNEKITWYKIDPKTPRYVIHSDAAVIAPLIFAHVLGD
jgi:deoxyhypusine synthase